MRGKGLEGGERASREAGIWFRSWSGGTAIGSSSPSSVMRTARRGSGRGAKRMLRRGWLAVICCGGARAGVLDAKDDEEE